MPKSRSLLVAAMLAAATALSHAAEFKKQEDCVVGGKVQNRENKIGTVEAVSQSMCTVRFEDGTKTSYLFWMLRPVGASTVTDDKLVKGVYPCYSSGNYLFMDVQIDGPDSYRDKKGNKGNYQLDAKTGKIVFTSGPLQPASAKLLAGPQIGLNMNGGSFYNTVCSLKK